jgi:hypothetical protein
MSQGRAIRWTVSLFDSIEELIGENDRRCDNDNDNDNDMTVESVFHLRLTRVAYRFTNSQDHLQSGYIALNNALPWFHQKASDMEHNDYINMLKKVSFASINDSHCDESLFSLDRVPTALEEMTPRNSRALSLIGSTASSNPILQSILKINFVVDSLTTCAANYSAQQS